MKKIVLLVALLSYFVNVSAQLVIRPAGYTVLGQNDLELTQTTNQPISHRDTITSLKIYGPKYNGGRGRLSFGDQCSKYVFNAVVGELTKAGEYDTDILQLQGKYGTYITAGVTDTLAYYDVAKGDQFKFNCDITSRGVLVASDKRFKENIQPINNALNAIEGLNAVSYNLKPTQSNSIKALQETPEYFDEKYQKDFDAFNKLQKQKSENTLRYGFVAQEVNKVMPELVRTDADGYMYVDYISLVPMLCQAINELKAKIVELTGNETGPKKAPAFTGANELQSDMLTPALYQNTPNPFTSETQIRYDLPETVQQAVLYVYDMQGKQIKSITVEERGSSSVSIQGSELPAGMYIYALIADGKEIASKRMILTK
ncbi:MAG: tail fiber domain-containing protein [Bacteroidales bacterium]|nr:tail fiber domain-containing protein [Candidatus Sodaliphilus fimicaballi]